MHMLSRQISTSRTTSLTARTLLSEAFKQFHPGRSGFLFHSAPVFNSRQSHESSCRVFPVLCFFLMESMRIVHGFTVLSMC